MNDNFGFKSVKTPPKNEHLNAFENDMYDMVRNIEFENAKSSFQHQLQNDAKRIKQDPRLLITADKTSNLYRLTTDEYNKLLLLFIIIKTLFTFRWERKIYRNEMITGKDKKVAHACHSRASGLQAKQPGNAKAPRRKRRKLAHLLLWI